MTRSRGVTPMSNLDVVNLLKAWGFEEAGYKGGHMVMSFNGRRVQVAAPHRSKGETPYKALRKAARILGISLKAMLVGPIRTETPKRIPVDPEPKEQTPMTTDIADIEDAIITEYRCEECGDTFGTKRALGGHATKHKKVRCNQCGDIVVQSGLGAHQRGCRPKKRGPGRPRKYTAEAVGRPVKAHDVGIEVPILDDMDEEFPTPEDFLPDEPASVLDGSAATEEPVRDSEQYEHVMTVFFPDLTTDQKQKVIDWVEATRALITSLPDKF